MEIYHQLICGGGRWEWLCRSWVDRTYLRANRVVSCVPSCSPLCCLGLLFCWSAGNLFGSDVNFSAISRRKIGVKNRKWYRVDYTETVCAWRKENMRGSTAGLAEGIIASPSTIHATFLVFLDILFSSLIVAPAVINYWRGTWNLMAYVLFPKNMFLSAIASSVLAATGNFVLAFCQQKFSRTFHPDKHRVTFYIFSRIYSLVFGLISVNSWRGIWMLMDQYVPYKVSVLLLITGTSLLILALCKGLRNISSQPFALSTDHSKDYFVIPTMWKSTVRMWCSKGFWWISESAITIYTKIEQAEPELYLNHLFLCRCAIAAIQRARILLHRLCIFCASDWIAGCDCVAGTLGFMWSGHLSRAIGHIGVGISGEYL